MIGLKTSRFLYENFFIELMNRHYVMVFIFIFFICFSSFLLFYSLISGHEVISSESNKETNSTIFRSKIPLCVNKLLNEHEYDFSNFIRTQNNASWLIFNKRNQRPCQLLNYSVERTVACLDILNQEPKSQDHCSLNKAKELYFVFMGDSRIRQQFFNFLRLIPDYDQKTQPDPMPFFVHEDMDFTSNMLRLRVSFKWRPLIDTNVTDTIRKWLESPLSHRPNWILLSMEIHHMLKLNGADYDHYLKKLLEFSPLLGKFAQFSKVIWLNQYPTIDPTHWDIFSEKIQRYNEGVRELLKNYSNVWIWDSSNIFAEEYVRSCVVFSEREAAGEFSLQYTTCRDYIHTGYTALAQATQLFLNQICNLKFNKIK